jgi:hypothetical protein
VFAAMVSRPCTDGLLAVAFKSTLDESLVCREGHAALTHKSSKMQGALTCDALHCKPAPHDTGPRAVCMEAASTLPKLPQQSLHKVATHVQNSALVSTQQHSFCADKDHDRLL